jgi:hypothetical protein
LRRWVEREFGEERAEVACLRGDCDELFEVGEPRGPVRIVTPDERRDHPL